MSDFNNSVLRVAGMLCYISENDAHSMLVDEGMSTETAHFHIRAAAIMVKYKLA